MASLDSTGFVELRRMRSQLAVKTKKILSQ